MCKSRPSGRYHRVVVLLVLVCCLHPCMLQKHMENGMTYSHQGQRFGRLVALHTENGKWRCLCDCGAQKLVFSENLTSGNTQSCGCLLLESRKKHGRSGTPMYKVWLGMRQRCYLQSCRQFNNYGGRGIRVCERWKDFENFLADMGERPDGAQIDRIDNNGNYAPENCRWATQKQNMRNTRHNRLIEWRGETLPLAAWAERLGINERTFTNRLNRGWPLERAMTEPINK